MSPTRWFDENGKEMFHEQINPDELEHIAEIGGTIEEFSVGINFYSEKLDKDEITRLIGIQPKKAWNSGDLQQVGNTKKTRITDWGKWYYTTERDATDLNSKIKGLLDLLTQDLDIWGKLTSKYQTWIDVAGYMNNWNRGFTIKPEIMRLLADRNIEVSFDIYFFGDDDENK